MAKAVTLKNQNNEEVYPVTDISLVNGELSTARIADGAVTSAKIDEGFIDALYYKSGEVIENVNSNGVVALTGGLTTGNTDFYVTIPVAKKLDNITSATVNKMRGYARCHGAYLTNMNSNQDAVEQATSVVARVDANLGILYVMFHRNAGWGTTNNAAVSFQVSEYKITLS